MSSIPSLLLATTLALPLAAGASPAEDPRALLLEGRALQRDGNAPDPKAAITLYRRALALEPRSAELHLRLSEALVEAGEEDAALEPAQQATVLAPRNGEAWAHLGALLYHRCRKAPENLGPARKALRRATRLIPGDPEIQVWLAQACEMQKDPKEALQVWLRLARQNPPGWYRTGSGEPFPLVVLAWERVERLANELGSYDAKREAVLSLVARRRVPDLRALEDLARDQVDKGYFGHAEESFRLLGTFMPQEPLVWENIAVVQLRTSRYVDALQSFQQAEALRSTPRLNLNIGLCLLNLGRLAEAEARLRPLAAPAQGFRVDKEAAQLRDSARALLATCLLLEGRPQEVLTLLKEAGELGDRPDLMSLKVQALVQTREWSEARELLRKGMAAEPRRGIFHEAAALPPEALKEGLFNRKASREALAQLDLEAMANLWAEFRGWEPCLRLVRQARARKPQSMDLLLLEAQALEQLGRVEESLAVLRQGQKLDPENAVLQNNLGYTLLERGGSLDEAARLVGEAYRKDPTSSSVADSWGWALYRKGRLDEAEKVLRKAVQLNPGSPESLKHLGEVLLKLDRGSEAVELWERAMAFVFPERQSLEKRLQELRTNLARQESKREAKEAGVEADEDEDEASRPEGQAPEGPGSEGQEPEGYEED